MSLKAETHNEMICEIQVVTPHGARQKFGMLIFLHEMTSSPLPIHLTPLPCLLSHMNWLPHQPPKYASTPTTAPQQSPILMLWHPYLILSATYHAYAPAAPSRYASDTGTPFLPSPILSG
ncbi:hypothetical protein O181_042143 [Austropuccinia psidii MF-1]|uniref:Uncharacterized protein n=1 Tax=Austropuccinia psidii MF-1 TaxID=1389203 RepID=A0A9Q3DIS8_9BASI|nr:hypothetical protein [Austropuccinia psidii MF-1]